MKKTADDIRKLESVTFSASSIQNYLACPAKFYFATVKGLKEGVITRAHLERNARNILKLMLRTHLYSDRSYYESVQGRCITFEQE